MFNQMIPKAFFVTGGKAISKISRLNTFDLALKDARISQCNLVKVSSIIPPKCREIEIKKLLPGSITFVVISRAEGTGKTISSGISWGIEENGGYGVVAEAYGNITEEFLRKDLKKKVMTMAKIRGIKTDSIKFRIETLDVPNESYGCVITALVYLF